MNGGEEMIDSADFQIHMGEVFQTWHLFSKILLLPPIDPHSIDFD